MDNYQERIDSIFEKLVDLLNTLPRPKSQHDEDLNLYDDWAKVVLTLMGQERPWNSSLQSDYELGCLAEQVFEEVHSLTLQLTILDLLCKSKKAEPLVSQRHARKGLEIARRLGSLKEIQTFENHMKADEMAIVTMYQNKFLIFSSKPISLRANNSGSASLSFDLRESLIQTLANSKKDLKVEFATFTKQRFEDLHKVNNGCRVLVLDMTATRSQTLYLEDGSLGMMPFTLADLDSFSQDLAGNFGSVIEVVIILNGDPAHLKPFFRLLSVKHFVYFSPRSIDRELDDPSTPEDSLDLLLAYWFTELKHNFVNLFFEYLTSNVSRDDLRCLKLAQSESVDSTNNLIKDCSYYRCQINHWKTDSMLMEKDLVFSTDSIIIESTEGIPRPIANEFADGVLEDNSTPGWKVKDSPGEYITRDQELLDISGLLLEQPGRRVNIWGTYGVGKTFIAKKLEYELAIRQIYRDGIFYFDLKQMDRAPSIRKQMSSKLGYEFLIDTAEFFRQKKDSLLILDGYDRVVSGGLQEPISLLQALEANNISVVFVTEADEAGRQRDIPDTVGYKVERLPDLHSLQFMLLAIAKRYQTFMTFSRDSLDKFAHSTMVRDCHGLPNVLLKNLKRIFSKGLGIKLESSQLQFSKRGSDISPHLHQSHSWQVEENLSDFDEDSTSQPSLYQSSGGPPCLYVTKKQPPMAKAKSKADSKKEGKQDKHKVKKKLKKEMR
jgi:hypothetical protein